MDAFDDMEITFRRDGDRSTRRLVIRARSADYGIFLVVSVDELSEAIRRWQSVITDGFHRIDIAGDVWMVYDRPGGAEAAREVTMRVVTFRFPARAVETLLRFGKLLWAQPGNVEVAVTLSKARRERWLRLYGDGHGLVDQVKTDEANAIIAANPDIAGCVERVCSIARASTRSLFQRASVRMSKDGPNDLYWTALSPKGRVILSGGIIRHSDGYAIHT